MKIMPWRREEVAPYCYEERYIPDTHEKFYYSWVERTPEERDRLYHEVNKIPYESEREEPTPEQRSHELVMQADEARRNALSLGKTKAQADWAAEKIYADANGWEMKPEPADPVRQKKPKDDGKIHLMKPLRLKADFETESAPETGKPKEAATKAKPKAKKTKAARAAA
jgi:hypothetical protein